MSKICGKCVWYVKHSCPQTRKRIGKTGHCFKYHKNVNGSDNCEKGFVKNDE